MWLLHNHELHACILNWIVSSCVNLLTGSVLMIRTTTLSMGVMKDSASTLVKLMKHDITIPEDHFRVSQLLLPPIDISQSFFTIRWQVLSLFWDHLNMSSMRIFLALFILFSLVLTVTPQLTLNLTGLHHINGVDLQQSFFFFHFLMPLFPCLRCCKVTK